MTDQHPITPPLELFRQWENDILSERENVDLVLDCAWKDGYRTGADKELQACVEWLAQNCGRWELSSALFAARRPKPPNLVEEALEEIQQMEDAMYSADLGCDFTATRAALERLQHLEQESNDN